MVTTDTRFGSECVCVYVCVCVCVREREREGEKELVDKCKYNE